MRILFVEGFDRNNWAGWLRVRAVGRYLEQHGHAVDYGHLQLAAEQIPLLTWLPRVMQAAVIRLLSPLASRTLKQRCRQVDRVILYNTYTSLWLIPFLRAHCGGYAYDTVDFSDTQNIIKLHCPSGIKGMLLRWRFRWNYRAFLKYVDGAGLVLTNTEQCADLVAGRGGRAWLFFCPLDADYVTPRTPTDKRNVPVIGWLGSAGTAFYIKEYLEVFAEFVRAGRARVQFMDCDQTFADLAGAAVVTWTAENVRHCVPQWFAGIAPLPLHLPMEGKFPSKILYYMAAGIPSIVTPKGMARYLIKHGETGLYAETPDDWRRCIQFLLEHPDDVARMGANARRDFETRFSLEAQMPEYERVVLGITSAPPVRRS